MNLVYERKNEFTRALHLCSSVAKTEHVHDCFYMHATSFIDIVGRDLSSKKRVFSGQNTIAGLPRKMLNFIWHVQNS